MVFQILAEIEMMRNENLLFGRHFETVQTLYIFFLKYGCVYTYGVKIIKKLRWESGFLKEPPLCTNGSAGYLVQLNVKTVLC